MDERDEELVIPGETVLEQKLIPFEGDDLLAARGESGIYIGVPGLCAVFSLDAASQARRMKTTRNLARGLRIMSLKGKRGYRDTTCLHVRKVAIWLAGIDTARVSNPAMADKIDTYQERLEDAATHVFFETFAPSTMVALAPVTIEEEYQDAMGLATLLREHLEMSLGPVNDQLAYIILMLEQLVSQEQHQDQTIAKIDARTQGLSNPHRYTIKRMVDAMIVMGAQMQPPLTYRHIYGPLIHRFRVTSYRDISDDQFEAVEQFLRELQQKLLADAPGQARLFD
jgi:hypothetical protein